MSSRATRRDMHSSSSQGCSVSICCCSVSRSGTSMTDAPMAGFSSSRAHASGERDFKSFFLAFSSIGGMGGRSSFSLFFVETKEEPTASWEGDARFCVSTTMGAGCLRGRPPLAPLARFSARRCRLSSIAGDSRAKASLRPELLRYRSASSPPMRAVRARNRRPSSPCLSVAATVIIMAGSISMLSVFFISKRGLLMVFEFLFATKVNHCHTIPPCQKAQPDFLFLYYYRATTPKTMTTTQRVAAE